ncbi:MAG: hypothetical protein K8S15_00230 [Candidatus Aegiribacteria sp.]|nr:hypothetical protein [Candidatus Aegiribacteria sp.]
MHDIYTPEWSQSRNFSQEIYPSEPRALSISNPHVARLLERTLDRRILKHLEVDAIRGIAVIFAYAHIRTESQEIQVRPAGTGSCILPGDDESAIGSEVNRSPLVGAPSPVGYLKYGVTGIVRSNQ